MRAGGRGMRYSLAYVESLERENARLREDVGALQDLVESLQERLDTTESVLVAYEADRGYWSP